MSITLASPWAAEAGPDCTPAQVRERVRVYRSAPPAYDAATMEEVIRIGFEVATQARGLASAGWAQSLHETAGYRYGRQVQPEQWNFGGLGATNDGASGGSFPSIWHGWMAFWAHHMNYWWGAFGNWPPWAEPFKTHAYRNSAVLSAGYGGVVHTIGDYTNGRWAWSPQYPKGSLENGYAYAMRDGANAILALPRGEESPPMAGPYEHVIRGLIDRRGELAINRGSPSPYGPSTRVTFPEKRGVVVHYGGPPPSNPGTFAVAQSYASYHVSKNWSTSGSPIYGDGLMYHVAIGSKGEKWLCRDLEAMLWHCGVTEWNKRSLAIQFLIGGAQRATAAQLKAASEVCDDWRAFTSTPRHEVWGHMELSSTDCPGTLMADFVRPYRAGTDMEDDMPPPAPERIKLEGNPFGDFEFVAGVAGFVWQLGWVRAPADPYAGILSVVGYPKENEHGTDFGAEQKCEKATIHWLRDAAMPWDVQLGTIKDAPSGPPPPVDEELMGVLAAHSRERITNAQRNIELDETDLALVTAHE